jgi:FG-GAP-like repeat
VLHLSLLRFADLNKDGKPDLVVTNYGSASVSVFLGNGDGSFQPQSSYRTGSGSTSVAVGDENGDGKPGLVVANELSASVSVLLGNGDGTFQAQDTYAPGVSRRIVAKAE